MTTTLTGNGAVYDNTVVAPADGDVANGTLFQAGFQRVLNTSRWLYEKVSTVGVDAVRSVADTAALKALTGMATGATAIVRGQGTYVYVDPDATAEALPFVVAPTVGTGRWTRAFSQSNRIVATGGSRINTTIAVPNGTVDVATATLTFTGPKTGDVLEFDVTGNSQSTGATDAHAVTVVAGSAVVLVGRIDIQHSTSQTVPFALATRYVCLLADETAGTVTAKVQTFRSTTLNLNLTVDTVRGKLIRP